MSPSSSPPADYSRGVMVKKKNHKPGFEASRSPSWPVPRTTLYLNSWFGFYPVVTHRSGRVKQERKGVYFHSRESAHPSRTAVLFKGVLYIRMAPEEGITTTPDTCRRPRTGTQIKIVATQVEQPVDADEGAVMSLWVE